METARSTLSFDKAIDRSITKSSDLPKYYVHPSLASEGHHSHFWWNENSYYSYTVHSSHPVFFLLIPKLFLNQKYFSQQKPRFWECYTCFGCETKTGVVRILVIFQGRPMFSHNWKLSPRPLERCG